MSLKGGITLSYRKLDNESARKAWISKMKYLLCLGKYTWNLSSSTSTRRSLEWCLDTCRRSRVRHKRHQTSDGCSRQEHPLITPNKKAYKRTLLVMKISLQPHIGLIIEIFSLYSNSLLTSTKSLMDLRNYLIWSNMLLVF